MTKEPITAKLTIPQAILVAGALIAGAILINSIAKQQSLQRAGQPDTAVTADANAPAEDAGLARLVLPFEPGVDHVRGAENPKITIYEYSDIDCPFCHRFHGTLQEIVAAYPNDVRWVYRHLPLEQLHPEARQKAVIAECVFAQQGAEAFWGVVDEMYANPSSIAELPDYVAEYQLDEEVYQACLVSADTQARVQRDITNAFATKGGGSIGTPWSIIGLPDGTFIPLSGAQPTAVVTSIIDAILAQTR